MIVSHSRFDIVGSAAVLFGKVGAGVVIVVVFGVFIICWYVLDIPTFLQLLSAMERGGRDDPERGGAMPFDDVEPEELVCGGTVIEDERALREDSMLAEEESRAKERGTGASAIDDGVLGVDGRSVEKNCIDVFEAPMGAEDGREEISTFATRC